MMSESSFRFLNIFNSFIHDTHCSDMGWCFTTQNANEQAIEERTLWFYFTASYISLIIIYTISIADTFPSPQFKF